MTTAPAIGPAVHKMLMSVRTIPTTFISNVRQLLFMLFECVQLQYCVFLLQTSSEVLNVTQKKTTTAGSFMTTRCKLFAVLILVVLVSVPSATMATILVGVKKGDRIEYQVSITGSMPDHDAQWARMDVVNTQGPVISTNMTTQFTNGTYLYENISLNLETGQLGDDFFIPANLSMGDVFFDAHAGNITIIGAEQRTYAGAERTVITGHTPETSFYWDKQTGILVEAYSAYTAINFTMKTVTAKTNIWQPQVATGAELVYAIVLAAIVVVIGVLVLLIRRKRNPTK
jgi:hypothetical protein